MTAIVNTGSYTQVDSPHAGTIKNKYTINLKDMNNSWFGDQDLPNIWTRLMAFSFPNTHSKAQALLFKILNPKNHDTSRQNLKTDCEQLRQLMSSDSSYHVKHQGADCFTFLGKNNSEVEVEFDSAGKARHIVIADTLFITLNEDKYTIAFNKGETAERFYTQQEATTSTAEPFAQTAPKANLAKPPTDQSKYAIYNNEDLLLRHAYNSWNWL